MSVVAIGGFALFGILLLLLVEYLVHRPGIVLWIVLTLLVLDALVSNEYLSVEIAGFRIGVSDIGFALVAAAAVFRLLRVERSSAGQKVLVTFGLLTVVSLIDGIGGASIQDSVNEFRTYLAFVSSALYFSTVGLDLKTRKAMTRAWMAAGIGLGTIAVARWSARLTSIDLGIFDATDPSSGFDAAIRVLNGPHVLMLTTCALFLLLPGLENGINLYPTHRRVGILLLLMSIALNRRTLWVGLALVLIVVLVRNKRLGLRIVATTFAVLTILVIALPLFHRPDRNLQPVAQSIDNLDTLVWRFDGWLALLDSGPNSPDEVILGLPFGSGFTRYVDGIENAVGPHNFYLQTYLRSGILGLISFSTAILLAFAGVTSFDNDVNHPLATRHLMMALLLSSVWMLTWAPLADAAVVLGLAIATGTRPESTPVTLPSEYLAPGV